MLNAVMNLELKFIRIKKTCFHVHRKAFENVSDTYEHEYVQAMLMILLRWWRDLDGFAVVGFSCSCTSSQRVEKF